MKSPDDICEKYSAEVNNLNIFVEDKTVIIEGDKKTLEFLAELINSQAMFEKDDGFQISPNGAGKVFFKDTSGYGLYVHRTQ